VGKLLPEGWRFICELFHQKRGALLMALIVLLIKIADAENDAIFMPSVSRISGVDSTLFMRFRAERQVRPIPYF
jgi:hypothetical protein